MSAITRLSGDSRAAAASLHLSDNAHHSEPPAAPSLKVPASISLLCRAPREASFLELYHARRDGAREHLRIRQNGPDFGSVIGDYENGGCNRGDDCFMRTRVPVKRASEHGLLNVRFPSESDRTAEMRRGPLHCH